MDTADEVIANAPVGQKPAGRGKKRKQDVESYLENEERYLGLDPEKESARRRKGKKLEGVHVIGDFVESFRIMAFSSDLIDSDIDSGRLVGFYVSVMAVLTLIMAPVFIAYGNSASFRSSIMPPALVLNAIPKFLTSGLAGTVLLFLIEHFLVILVVLLVIAALYNWIGKMLLGFSGDYRNSLAAMVFGYLPLMYIGAIELVMPFAKLNSGISTIIAGALIPIGLVWGMAIAVVTASKQQGVGYAKSFLALILAWALLFVVLDYLAFL